MKVPSKSPQPPPGTAHRSSHPQKTKKHRRQNLRMEICHGKIKSRQSHGKERCDIAQKPAETCDFPPVVIIIARLNERIIISRQDQPHRGIVRKHNHPSLQNSHCCTIRPLCRLKLWKWGIPLLLSELFDHTTVLTPCRSQILQPVPDLPYQSRIHQILHKNKINIGIRAHTTFFLLHLDFRGTDTLSNQRRILFYRITKPLV